MESPNLTTNADIAIPTNDLSIHEALSEWNLTRTSLVASSQVYMDAFSRFEAACVKYFQSHEFGIAKLDLHAAIDKEILSLPPDESSLAASRLKLLRLKNSSIFVSPVVKLPTEALAHIFTLFVNSCRTYYVVTRSHDESVTQLNTVASVCSYWRDTAINTPSLWSYFDFDRLRNMNLIHLWLDRARGCPLDIVARHYHRFLHLTSSFSLFPLVQSRINCLRSILLYSIESETGMERQVSELCTNGTPRTLTTLSLSINSPSGHREIQFPAREAIRSHMEELLYNLTALNLRSITVNWGLVACQNLVTLSLSSLNITMESLQQILIANRRLQHAYLTKLHFVRNLAAIIIPSAPSIQLDHLQTLELVDLPASKRARILSMIVPGSCELSLLLDPYCKWESNDVLKREFFEFCRRARVKSLCCRSLEALREAITAVPKLEFLVLQDVTLSDELCDLIVPPLSDNDYSSHPYLPNLHTLYILECPLGNRSDLNRICSACPIRNVGISEHLPLANGSKCTVQEIEQLVGPGITVSVVPKDVEMGYMPFGRY